MADNKVQVDVKVTDSGTLVETTKKSRNLKTGLEDVAQSAHTADRNLKGAAQASSNSTKNFSKMAQGISRGIVPAYATLAANIFAVGAAFRVLSNAAQVQQLEEGLDKIGAASGRTLKVLAADLKEVTGAALSTEAAMRAVTFASSGGFSADQIRELGVVAKNSSIALGRDLNDSMNRLIRGSVKMEAELLDDVGIMVKIGAATERYAAKIGTTANKLTEFQRRQAFLNAILDEGRKNFGDIGGEVSVNEYDKLLATFQDLSVTVTKFISGGLQPFVELLSKSSTALLGVVTLFVSTISNQMFPIFDEMADEAAKSAIETDRNLKRILKASSSEAVKYITDIENSAVRLGDKGKQALAQLRVNPKDKTAALSLQKSLEASIRSTERAISSGKVGKNKLDEASLAAAKANRLELERTLKLTQAILKEEITSLSLQKKSAIARRDKNLALIRQETVEATSNDLLSPLERVKAGLAGVKASYREFVAGTTQAALVAAGSAGKVDLLSASLIRVRGAARAAGLAMSLLGRAIFSIIPIIGQVLLVASLLRPAFDWIGTKLGFIDKEATAALNKSLERAQELAESLGEKQQALARLHKSSSTEATKYSKSLVIIANSTNELVAAYDDLLEKQKELDKGPSFIKSLQVYSQRLALEREIMHSQPINFANPRSVLPPEEELTFRSQLRIDYSGVEEQLESLYSLYAGNPDTLRAFETDQARFFGITFKNLSEFEQKLGSTDIKNMESFNAAWKAFLESVKGGSGALGGITRLSELAQSAADTVKSSEDVMSRFKASFKVSTNFDDVVGTFTDINNAIEQVLAASEKSGADITSGMKVIVSALQSAPGNFTATLGDEVTSILDSVAETNVLTKEQATQLASVLRTRQEEFSVLQRNSVQLQLQNKLIDNMAGRVRQLSSAAPEAAAISAELSNLSITNSINELKLLRSKLQGIEDTSRITLDILDLEQRLTDERIIQQESLVNAINFEKELLSIGQERLAVSRSIRESMIEERQRVLRQEAFAARGTDRISTSDITRFEVESAVLRSELAKEEITEKLKMLDKEREVQNSQRALLVLQAEILAEQLRLAGKGNRGTELLDSVKKSTARIQKEQERLYEIQKEQLNRSLEGISDKLYLEIFDATKAALTANPVYKAFTDGVKSSLIGVLKGDASVKEAIGSLAISVLDSILERAVDDLIDMLTNQVVLSQPIISAHTQGGAIVASQIISAWTSAAAATKAASVITSGSSMGLIEKIVNFFRKTEVKVLEKPEEVSSAKERIDKKIEKRSKDPAYKEMVEKESAIAIDERPFSRFTQSINNLFQSFGETLRGVLGSASPFFSGLSKVFSSAWDWLKSIFTSLFATQAASSTASSAGSSIVSSLGNFFASSFAAANGGIAPGGFKAFANGGIVKQPTLGLVGEGRHNEAIVPLPNGRSIPVDFKGSSNTVNNVSVSVNMETGQTKTEANEDSLAQMGAVIASIVERALVDNMRPGGLLAK